MINKEENYIGLGENLVDCLSCQEKISETDFYAKYRICPFCNFHYSVDFSKRLEIISDQGSFVEFNKNITVRKPKNLKLNQNYKKNVKTTRERTGLEEAVITGTCNIGGIKSVIILLDFGFLGGSMGIIVGEKVSKAFSYSRKNSLPVLSVISSGGRRVQEGVFSLIQMIKTTNATDELNDKKLPHVSILTNPSGGQVYSSFAISADIKIAEPGAIIGMFSRNEIAKTSIDNEGVDLTSENFFENGLIDNIISRNNLKKEISSILESLTSNNKIPKKVDLELPEIEFLKSNQTKKIEKSRPSAKQYLNIIFDDVISLKDNNEKNLSTLGIAKLGPQSVIYLIQNFQRINKSNDGKLNINDFERIKDAIKLSKKFKLPTIFFVDNKGINNTFK
ncbi:MAG: carboxyl transferase domain-containing protein, partial [Chloroflexota bacterium]|nr:carboxyl transferase domain-containing protein [Chloroflexota bacterium]